jgi:hypothetical protein
METQDSYTIVSLLHQIHPVFLFSIGILVASNIIPTGIFFFDFKRSSQNLLSWYFFFFSLVCIVLLFVHGMASPGLLEKDFNFYGAFFFITIGVTSFGSYLIASIFFPDHKSLATDSLFQIKKKEILELIAIFSIIFISGVAFKFGFIRWLPIFGLITAIGIIINGILKKKEGCWVIGIGGIVFCCTFLYLILINPDSFVYVAGIVSIVVAISIYISNNFVNTRTENLRKTQELEEARQLQFSMLPNEKPSLPQLDISWYMETATEVGGDYYDYSVGEDGVVSVILGDATGHGMQAGTVVTATKSLFQSHADHPIITETFSAMSRSLKGMNLPRLGMAMTMVKIQDRKLQISSAGIPPALLYRAASKEIEEIEIGGMPLGYSTSFQYQQEEYDLNPGDTLVLMSDGLPERLNDQDEELGYPKTQELFRQCAEMTPDAICAHLATGGDAWANGRGQDDDVTFVVLKMK